MPAHVFGILDLLAKTRRSVDSSAELALISASVLSFGSTTDCPTTTVCESGGSQETPSLKS